MAASGSSASDSATMATTASAASASCIDGMEYSPPLPSGLLEVLEKAQLAYLATVEEGLPHLSLMRFTSLTDPALGHVLVLTTRRDTRKYRALIRQPQVSVSLTLWCLRLAEIRCALVCTSDIHTKHFALVVPLIQTEA